MSDQLPPTQYANPGLYDDLIFGLPRPHSLLGNQQEVVQSNVGQSLAPTVEDNQFDDIDSDGPSGRDDQQDHVEGHVANGVVLSEGGGAHGGQKDQSGGMGVHGQDRGSVAVTLEEHHNEVVTEDGSDLTVRKSVSAQQSNISNPGGVKGSKAVGKARVEPPKSPQKSKYGMTLKTDRSGHTSLLNSAMKDLQSYPPDVTFCARDGKLEVNRLLLSLYSPTLNSVISDWAPSTSILLPDFSIVSVRILIELLMFGYSSYQDFHEIQDIPCEDFENVFEIAKLLQIQITRKNVQEMKEVEDVKAETKKEYIEEEIKDEYSSGNLKIKFEDVKVEIKNEHVKDEIKEEMEEVKDVKVETKKENIKAIDSEKEKEKAKNTNTSKTKEVDNTSLQNDGLEHELDVLEHELDVWNTNLTCKEKFSGSTAKKCKQSLRLSEKPIDNFLNSDGTRPPSHSNPRRQAANVKQQMNTARPLQPSNLEKSEKAERNKLKGSTKEIRKGKENNIPDKGYRKDDTNPLKVSFAPLEGNIKDIGERFATNSAKKDSTANAEETTTYAAKKDRTTNGEETTTYAAKKGSTANDEDTITNNAMVKDSTATCEQNQTLSKNNFQTKYLSMSNTISKETFKQDGEKSIFEVTCKESKAEFHQDKFISGGQGLCILFKESWMTPNAFEKVAGSKAKKYKESLKVNGKPIKHLIDPDGLLDQKYICELCSKSFIHKSKLVQHMSSHDSGSFDKKDGKDLEEEKQCRCECGAIYKNPLLLKFHKNQDCVRRPTNHVK